MKNLKLVFTLLIASLIIVTSCSKDDDGFQPIQETFTPPTAADFKAAHENAFNNLKQFASFNAENGITFVSEAGVTLIIQPNCITLDGNHINGLVDLEFVEIFERGDMITTNKTTTGKKPDNTFEPLISGGQFFVKVLQDNIELATNCGYFISVPTHITGGDQQEMTGFKGELDEADNLIWLPSNDEFWLTEFNDISSYNAFTQDFEPFNCDYFVSFPEPKTDLQISLPQGFDLTNSAIYVAIPEKPNSLALLFGKLPIGFQMHIIFVSVEAENYRYAIKSITVQDNQQLLYTLEETNVVTLSQLKAILNNLN